MKRPLRKSSLRTLSILCGLSLAAQISQAQGWKLYGLTGQQGDDTAADSGTGFKWPDHTLYEINTGTAATTQLFTLNFINDTLALGYNPQNHLLYHTGGSQSYSNNPLRNGHDQGGDSIPGVGYQDSQYMETVDPITGVAHAIFNAAPCPNPDPTLPCFGLPAPRPTWVRPEVQRDSTQTDGSFRERGLDEYDAARNLTWSAEKGLFYISDDTGIYTLSPAGESHFVGRPAFLDGQVDESKAIAFVKETALFVGHRSGANGAGYLMRINPETGDVVSDLALKFPTGGGDPQDIFGGLLGLVQHPVSGVVYGIRNTDDHFARELVKINPVTGDTELVGNMGMHIASIAFAQASAGAPWKLFGISGQQGDDTAADSGTGFKWPDHSLFEINTTSGAVTMIKTLTFVNDSNALGYNPNNFLLYHTAGSESYSNNPLRNGHDQGGDSIPGVGYQDSQYMETVNPTTGAETAIFNSAPCPNPDSTLPCFGLPAPRPTWVLPEVQRDSTQTDGSFRARGIDEYHAARGMAWSKEKNLFYVADEQGVFKLTADGKSTFLARPLFPVDFAADEDKAIAFVTLTNLYVGHRGSGAFMRVNPDTGEALGEITLAVPTGGADPQDTFNGLLAVAQHPETGTVYGVRNSGDHFARELVTINTMSGETTLVGSLGLHVASIAFGQPLADEIKIDSYTQTAGTFTLNWSGGTGKYLVQKKVDLNSATWFNVVTTTGHSATVTKDGEAGFFRVVGSYTGPDVTQLTAYLSGDAEKQATAVNTVATGVGTLSMEGNTLNYLVTYRGLQSAPTASHIHGPFDSQTSGGVMKAFATPQGTNGYIMGTVALDATQTGQVLNGLGYVNIHTVNFQGGEIRGQVLRTSYATAMNGANEKPNAVTTPGTGSATITVYGNELTYNVSWANLTSAATAGHIHLPATAAQTASPVVFFSNVAGASGSTTGGQAVTQTVLGALADGKAYVNIHTINNTGGEIRGQLAPQ